MTVQPSGYPRRPPYFAHRYCRLLTKTCAANDIGPTAFVLCVTIAMIEDSKRYTGPVTFYTGQLLPLIGATKWDTLDHARQKAVTHGWLCYAPGARGKRQPGKYWVTIPDGLDVLDDSPCDESRYQETGNVAGKHYPANGDREGDRDGYRDGYRQGELSYLTLDPTPKRESASADSLPEELLEKERQLIVEWNKLQGVTPNRGKVLTTKRRARFRARLKSPDWLQEARLALAKFPLQCQLDAAGSVREDAWRPDVEWFLAPDSVTKILEGKYDFSKANGNGHVRRDSPARIR